MLFNLLQKAPLFVRQVGINAVANILSKAQLFVVAVVLARYFDVAEFASFGVILTAVGLISVFATVGLGPAMVRFVAAEQAGPQRDKVASSALTVNAGLSLLFCLLLFLLVPQVENALGYVSDSFSLALKIICPGIFVSLIAQLGISFFNGVERFDLVAKSQMVTAFVGLPLQLLLAITMGLPGFAIAFTISNLILLAVLTYYAVIKHKLIGGYAFDLTLCRSLLSFSFPSFISGIWPMPLMAFAFWRISTLDDAAFQAALLTSANQVFSILYFVPVMIAQVLMPKVAARQNATQQAEILRALLRKLIPAMLALCILMSLFSPIFPYLFDMPVKSTIWVFIGCIVTVAIVSIQTQVDHYNVGSGKVWLHCGLNTFWGIVFLLAIEYAFIWGALGIVLARLLAYFARSMVMIPLLPSFKPTQENN